MRRKMINQIAKDIVGYRMPAFDPFTNKVDGTIVQVSLKQLKRAGNVRNADQRYFSDRICHSNVFKGKHEKGFYEPGKN